MHRLRRGTNGAMIMLMPLQKYPESGSVTNELLIMTTERIASLADDDLPSLLSRILDKFSSIWKYRG